MEDGQRTLLWEVERIVDAVSRLGEPAALRLCKKPPDKGLALVSCLARQAELEVLFTI
jgi:hypothetical protein